MHVYAALISLSMFFPYILTLINYFPELDSTLCHITSDNAVQAATGTVGSKAQVWCNACPPLELGAESGLISARWKAACAENPAWQNRHRSQSLKHFNRFYNVACPVWQDSSLKFWAMTHWLLLVFVHLTSSKASNIGLVDEVPILFSYSDNVHFQSLVY